MTYEAARDDWEQSQELVKKLLTREEREELDRQLRHPRWDLHPPMREDYNSPTEFVLALKDFAGRCLKGRR